MNFQNHIANRFLNDINLLVEMTTAQLERDFGKVDFDNSQQNERIADMAVQFGTSYNTNYYIAESIMDKLSFIKLPEDTDKYDWSVFNGIPEGKYTIIYPDNSLTRVIKQGPLLWMMHLGFVFQEGDKNNGNLQWDMFYCDNGKPSSEANAPKIRKWHEKIFRTLCFVFLSNPETEIVLPGHRYGTKKNGKIVNTLNTNLIIVNKNWNITSIRTEGFLVSGHLAIRRTGPGRTIPKLVYIAPFEKHGYIRKSKITDEA